MCDTKGNRRNGGPCCCCLRARSFQGLVDIKKNESKAIGSSCDYLMENSVKSS